METLKPEADNSNYLIILMQSTQSGVDNTYSNLSLSLIRQCKLFLKNLLQRESGFTQRWMSCCFRFTFSVGLLAGLKK